jgi:hypothetical protein
MTGLLDDLPERLLTHFVGGAWRAPLSTRLVHVPGLGQVVLAGPADLARARALHRSAPRQDWDRLGQALATQGPALARALAGMGFPTDPSVLARIPCAVREVPQDWQPSPAGLVHALVLARLAQSLDLCPGALTVLPTGLR